jgi:hypothetical protein
MKTETVIFWIIVVLIVSSILWMTVHDRRESVVENLDSGSPSRSKVDAQMAVARRERNQDLYQKCNQMFGGDMKFLNACRTSNDSHIIYEKGIEVAHNIYMQNQRDGFIWGNNMYLSIVQGNMSSVICQIVYLDNPSMQSICFNSPENKKREMWLDYWENRRDMSRDWRLAPATLLF